MSFSMIELLIALMIVSCAADPCTKPHAFYYVWYGEPMIDGRWMHWDHEVLPHWTKSIAERYPKGKFEPPLDPHSSYFPAIGLYSSRNATVRRKHFQFMRNAGIGTAVVSWWGRPNVEGTHDTQGVNSDAFMSDLLDDAAQEGIRVSFHMEPYSNRTVSSVKEDVAYLHDMYASHEAMLWCAIHTLPGVGHTWHEAARKRGGGDPSRRCSSGPGERCGPVVFVFDSYHIPSSDWKWLLGGGGFQPLAKSSKGGSMPTATTAEASTSSAFASQASIRGTAYDVVAIGLWLDSGSGKQLQDGGFDGGYTYFGAEGFSHGSTPSRWPAMAAEASRRGLLFLPSVAPGYDDSRIRPWNKANRRDRRGGQYYKGMWEEALRLQPAPASVGVSTFNEWGEGTQIEPAVPWEVPEGEGISVALREGLGASRKFADYLPLEPEGYLGITAQMARLLEVAQADGSGLPGHVSSGRADEL